MTTAPPWLVYAIFGATVTCAAAMGWVWWRAMR